VRNRAVAKHDRPAASAPRSRELRHATLVGWLVLAMLVLAQPATAGWLVERATRTEGKVGPRKTVSLFISKGKVKEVHEDQTYFLWDLPRHTLYEVDPTTHTYSGGSIEKMIAAVKQYLDQMRDQLARMSESEREALARETGGMPMPVPPPATTPVWTVKRGERTEIIAGRKTELYEIDRDGKSYESRWIAAGFRFGKDLDYALFARWSRELESSFARGMGQDAPEGTAVEELDAKGLVMRSVLAGDGVRVVSEVVRLEARDVPDATFVLPVEYRQTARSSVAVSSRAAGCRPGCRRSRRSLRRGEGTSWRRVRCRPW
jgi:hypothetical protein